MTEETFALPFIICCLQEFEGKDVREQLKGNKKNICQNSNTFDGLALVVPDDDTRLPAFENLLALQVNS